MTDKRAHEYKVIFEYLRDIQGEPMSHEPVEFIFRNHDDIFRIFDVLTEKRLFEERDQMLQFAIGLKLFGDTIVKNKDMELFSEMRPAFMAFMKKLKSKE